PHCPLPPLSLSLELYPTPTQPVYPLSTTQGLRRWSEAPAAASWFTAGDPGRRSGHKQRRTYFSTITIVVDRPRRAYIEVTPKKVILDGRDRMVLPCHSTVAVDSGALSVAIAGNSNVTVTVAGNIVFVILLHRYKNPAPYQRDHLGFYVASSKGLSHDCHGLLGRCWLRAGGVNYVESDFNANEASLLIYIKILHSGKSPFVDCWFARNNAAKLIDGRYEDYLTSHMFDTGEWPNGV
uniref:Inter-alpha-trypsin inhibitor heavy chain C-terminal domain-containing protein n=1 Tax=Cyclopterus lumpus TaxID=8103 RepID=A0A8C2ZLL0_CYCLU